MARRHGLPVAIHTRDAEDDTAAILSNWPDVRGVMHCFTSSYNLAKKMLDRGFFFSASGILTFKNAAEIRETFAKIPLDRLVVETARCLAEIKNVSFEKMSDILTENTKKLYPKIKI